MKIEWFQERTGEGPYQHVVCGHCIDITDSPHRETYIRNGERENAKMRKALSESIFSDEGTGE
jgi:hypothetical protein